MEFGTTLATRFTRCVRCTLRGRLPALFLLSITLLVVLVWVQPSGITDPGQGAGGSGKTTLSVRTPANPAFCLPTDVECLVNSAASTIASNIQQAIQPLADTLLKNPADILYQTPLLNDTTSPQNRVLLTLNGFFVEVVEIALACLLVIGGYNAIVSRHLQMVRSSLFDVLPRAVLVMMAVQFNLFFVGLFIAFENALSLDILKVAAHDTLSNLLAGFFPNTGEDAIIAWILMIVIVVMLVMLLLQMITRLALVALSIALAPLGLGCFLLSQTLSWGRLWLVTLSSSVMVQAIQVTALALGTVFISALGALPIWHLDHQLVLAFLAIGIMGLVLKIPGMLQTWALRPMMDAGNSGGGGGSGSGQSTRGQPGDADTSNTGDTLAGGAMDSSSAAGGGGAFMNGTIVTEESGSLLLLF